jgi:RNA polymerase subunit RPABC4/transcription elongation factor Spt4
MDHQEWDGFDPARSRLRALVARVEAELVRLEDQSEQPRVGQTTALAQTWRDLVIALALGEERPLRHCPHCRRQVPREATRCRYCMRQSAAAGAQP